MVVVLVWLKLNEPVPAPNVTNGVVSTPAPSVPPTEPMFNSPEEPDWDPIVMPLEALTAPPLATVSEPPPYKPRVKVLSDQSDPEPVTDAKLLPEP